MSTGKSSRARGDTLAEIVKREADLLDAEQQALRNLAQHLRDAVDELPVESMLSRVFIRRAGDFDAWARQINNDARQAWADVTLTRMDRELRDIQPEGGED